MATEFTYELKNGSYTITGCTNIEGTKLEIPTTIDGKTIRAIDEWVFSGNGYSAITEVIIPVSITKIGTCAFIGCTNLKSITIPFVGADHNGSAYGSTSFGHLFDQQGNNYYVPKSLKKVTINRPSSTYTSLKVGVPSKAFYGCNNLEEVIITGSNVTSISSNAFQSCESLTSVTIGNSVTYIGSYAFQSCESLTSVVIPSNVKTIDDWAFYHCESLASVEIKNGVEKIGEGAFCYCKSLTEISIPESVVRIDSQAFSQAESLSAVTIAASDNTSLTLGVAIFAGCNAIQNLEIPYRSDLTFEADSSIDPSCGLGVLAGCNGLVNLTIPFIQKGITTWNGNITHNAYVLGALFNSDGHIPSNECVTVTQEYMYNGLLRDHDFNIPASLRSVTVTGGTDVISISSGAFSNCSMLESIDISGTTVSNSSFLFKGCTNLTTVKLPDSMTSIGQKAFYDCTGLSGTLTLPEKITTIGNQAFDLSTGTNSALTSLTIPHKISTMGENAFGNFSELTLYMKDRGPGANWSDTWNYCNIPVVWQYDVDVTCSIDFDYDLIQDDCHWDLDRYFKFTFKFLDPALEYSAVGYYRIGDYVEVPTGKTFTEKGYKILNDSAFYKRNNTWIYHLGVSDLDQTDIINNRDGEGNLKITAVVKTNEDIAHETFSKYLELPPTLAATRPNSTLPNVLTDYVQANPGEFVCTWNPATVADCDDNNLHGVDTVDGYCIEIFRKPAGSETFSKIYGLTWSDFYLTLTGSLQRYKLTKDSTDNYTEYIPTDNPLDFVLKTKSSSSQVYIENPLKTEFYFTPKDIGIESGDSYKILIYPYSHYEGALISTEGISSDGIDVPKGIVRVKTANGWVEGQVWVMTESGWKNAEVIYAKTADGWKEAQ